MSSFVDEVYTVEGLLPFKPETLPEHLHRGTSPDTRYSAITLRQKQVIEPNAMCLCTVGKDGKPSARFVLMKGYSERGVTWYTNYNRSVQ